jgi:hypothetical protein
MTAANALVQHALTPTLINFISVASGGRHARRLLDADSEYQKLVVAAVRESTDGSELVDAIVMLAEHKIEPVDVDTALFALLTGLVLVAPSKLDPALVVRVRNLVGPYCRWFFATLSVDITNGGLTARARSLGSNRPSIMEVHFGTTSTEISFEAPSSGSLLVDTKAA